MPFQKSNRDTCGLIVLSLILLELIITLIQMILRGETFFAIFLTIAAGIAGFILLYLYKRTRDSFPSQESTPERKVNENVGRA